jgi:hypothetical protein
LFPKTPWRLRLLIRKVPPVSEPMCIYVNMELTYSMSSERQYIFLSDPNQQVLPHTYSWGHQLFHFLKAVCFLPDYEMEKYPET